MSIRVLPLAPARVRVLAALATLLLALGAQPALAQPCAVDGDCDDGLACNGTETCNLGTLECDPGTPLADNTPCDVPGSVTCTFIDTCQSGVCTAGGGGDTDGDGTCEADDNCPGVANPDQADLDADTDGNACDPEDRILNVVVARVKMNIGTPAKPTGGLLARGDFLATPPEAPLSAATGMLVRVEDSETLDVTIVWPASECETNSKGLIKCKSPDKKKHLIVKPVNGSGGTLFRYTFRASRLDLQGPFFEPMVVTITTGPGNPPTLVTGLDRKGEIIDCRQTNIGMSCRE